MGLAGTCKPWAPLFRVCLILYSQAYQAPCLFPTSHSPAGVSLVKQRSLCGFLAHASFILSHPLTGAFHSIGLYGQREGQ
jgi:hypothetical protein